MPAIASVRYTHDAIIDDILENPAVSQCELARRFGYSQTWMSIIINSDAFKERLADRKGQLLDPEIIASVNERREAVAKLALDKLMLELERPGPKKIQDLAAAARLGIIDDGPKTQNNLYVVHVPTPAASTGGWLESAQGRSKPPEIIDLSHANPEP